MPARGARSLVRTRRGSPRGTRALHSPKGALSRPFVSHVRARRSVCILPLRGRSTSRRPLGGPPPHSTALARRSLGDAGATTAGPRSMQRAPGRVRRTPVASDRSLEPDTTGPGACPPGTARSAVRSPCAAVLAADTTGPGDCSPDTARSAAHSPTTRSAPRGLPATPARANPATPRAPTPAREPYRAQSAFAPTVPSPRRTPGPRGWLGVFSSRIGARCAQQT